MMDDRTKTALIAAGIVLAMFSSSCGKNDNVDQQHTKPRIKNPELIKFAANPAFSEFRYIVEITPSASGAMVRTTSYKSNPHTDGRINDAPISFTQLRRINRATEQLLSSTPVVHSCTDATGIGITVLSDMGKYHKEYSLCDVMAQKYAQALLAELRDSIPSDVRPNHGDWSRLPTPAPLGTR